MSRSKELTIPNELSDQLLGGRGVDAGSVLTDAIDTGCLLNLRTLFAGMWGMARIDRARLLHAPPGTLVEIATRYGDLDTQGHINNAAGAVILQEARADFNRTLSLRLGNGRRLMVVSQVIEYAAEMSYPAPVAVDTRLIATGRTSFTIGQVARQSGVAGLYSETVLVFANAEGPTPIPYEMRQAFEVSQGFTG